jgi:DNA-binding response OmpR family regulator
VEDNTDMAAALSIALGQQGYQVEVADSATQALRSAPDRFDVLVSDVGLPDGNGHDLLRALRRRGPVKAIALSGYGTEQDQGASREAGFAAHLTKPIDLDTLTSTIERLLARPGAPALV